MYAVLTIAAVLLPPVRPQTELMAQGMERVLLALAKSCAFLHEAVSTDLLSANVEVCGRMGQDKYTCLHNTLVLLQGQSPPRASILCMAITYHSLRRKCVDRNKSQFPPPTSSILHNLY